MIPAILFFSIALLGFTAIDSLSTSHSTQKSTSHDTPKGKESFDPLSDALTTIRETLREEKKLHMVSINYKLKGNNPIAMKKKVYYKEYRKKPVSKVSSLDPCAGGSDSGYIKFIYKPDNKKKLIRVAKSKGGHREVRHIRFPTHDHSSLSHSTNIV